MGIKNEAGADALPIECVRWTYSTCDVSQLVDAYTEDGRMVFEQWEAHEAVPYVNEHNEKIALAAELAR